MKRLHRDQVLDARREVEKRYKEELTSPNPLPNLASAAFWKSSAGITSAIVAAAAVAGALTYWLKKSPACPPALPPSATQPISTSSTAGPVSANPSVAVTQPASYAVNPGGYYVFDITSSSHWTDPQWTVAPLAQALQAAGWTVLSVQPDPSDPSASRYGVVAQWGGTTLSTQDDPPAWSIDPATYLPTASPLLPQSYAMPGASTWVTFQVATSFQPSDPNLAAYVAAILAANGFATPRATPTSANATVVNVAAQWTGAASGFTDGPPIWWLLAAPEAVAGNADPGQPGA